jgi:zinc transport system ATP-binding protein
MDSGSPVTVYDMLLSLTSPYPVFLPRRRKTVEKMKAHLARFRADGLLDHPVGRLSGGELQRVLLAAATMPVPDLLILDEPVSGVDRAGLEEFYRLLEELKAREDMVILLVSHDLAYVKQHADRVILLDKTVEARGTPEEVFATSAFAAAFGEGSV